jgi:hypothetical protein
LNKLGQGWGDLSELKTRALAAAALGVTGSHIGPSLSQGFKKAVRPGVGIRVWNRVELMKSSISCHQYDSMSAIGNLWNLSVVGPFIAGSVQMTKLTWSQCLQEILTTLWA